MGFCSICKIFDCTIALLSCFTRPLFLKLNSDPFYILISSKIFLIPLHILLLFFVNLRNMRAVISFFQLSRLQSTYIHTYIVHNVYNVKVDTLPFSNKISSLRSLMHILLIFSQFVFSTSLFLIPPDDHGSSPLWFLI